ncbi:MAG: hypothetical protein IT222_03925, partial [Crocinitomix sp.]|nr:hypothetical protein [Crocinitomix sp.]
SSNSKYKIFSRKLISGGQRLPEFSPRITPHVLSDKNAVLGQRNKSQINISVTQQRLDKFVDDLLISEFLPASVVINYQMEIL